MKSQERIMLFVIIILLTFQSAFTQTISQINYRIDSLEIVKKDLERKLKVINEEITNLKSKKEAMELRIFNSDSKVEAKTKSDTHLLSEPSALSEKIIFVPQKSQVEILDYDNTFYKAIYNDKIGFIWEYYIENDSMLEVFKKFRYSENRKKQIEEEKEQIRKDDEHRRLEAERQKKMLAKRRQILINKYGEKIATKILEHKIWLGMTKEMAIDSWGQPDDTNRTITPSVVREQLIYGKAYLYFENNILVSWQD